MQNISRMPLHIIVLPDKTVVISYSVFDLLAISLSVFVQLPSVNRYSSYEEDKTLEAKHGEAVCWLGMHLLFVIRLQKALIDRFVSRFFGQFQRLVLEVRHDYAIVCHKESVEGIERKEKV
jgi:hypothetical protein